MIAGNGFLSSLYGLIADFGSAYSGIIILFFNTVFRRPLFFIFRFIRRFVRLLFRGAVIFFAPADYRSDRFADEVTRCAKVCLKTLLTHPGSFPSVCAYYIKKALGRYTLSIKNILLWAVPIAVISAVLIGADTLSESCVALKITSGDELVGYVRSEEDYIAARNQARQASVSDSALSEISYSLSFVGFDKITDTDTLFTRLMSLSDKKTVRACGVYADGKLLGVLYSEADARAVMDSLLEQFASDEDNYTVSFKEEIVYEYGYYPEEEITDTESFLKTLNSGEKTEDIYTLRAGDTLSEVADRFSMTDEELRTLNGLDGESEEPAEGDTLKVIKYLPVLTVKETKTEITNEKIPYDTVKIESAALYSGSSRVLSEGKTGYAQVTSFVTLVDGKKVSSKEVHRLTVTEAVPEVVQIGTKSLDEAYSNSMGGIFLWPIVGAYGINSDYGYRWGKLHAGIDLGMGNAAGTSLGKDIIAVAQGTVIVAGVHSSYGYYVIIDHGGGLQTLYAHCLANSLMVTPGQVVAAGQPIARVGSTGYSTGPHLHFEVRVNGNRVNPRPYLGI